MASTMMMVRPFGQFVIYQSDTVMMVFADADADGGYRLVHVRDPDPDLDPFYCHHSLNEI